MSPQESQELILRHVLHDGNAPSEKVLRECGEVAMKLDYLSLAIDLAGAYIGNSPDPEQALNRYLTDYDMRRDELLRMNDLKGLLPTEKTAWTVWDATIQEITEENGQQPDLLLTSLAQFRGAIIQDEIFRLAALGIASINRNLTNEIPAEIRQVFMAEEGKWSDFYYQTSRDVLARHNLLQRVSSDGACVTMHNLVRWRAKRSGHIYSLGQRQEQQWHWWYLVVLVAA
ncbi:uncharacterized protein FMAN_14274 [Fusarium mangiferae]|uniref:Uncharacterized protein n=1 Tax=Fusarium mangiferae TaxID=192010 RepID=A0A1L7UF35_FUSMA|nr:uncharacterized protein FMAN_14274 [Fusarium mangiferae]CVL09268.1 uncharacterized protein FMAN_14274 [Fusarium mangiferae]